jgi:hypothetical protein
MRLLTLISLLSAFTAASVLAQSDPTLTLAQILSDKGTISVADLARVQTADQQSRLTTLASILQQKGVLNSGDLAKLSIPSGMPPAASAPQAVAARSEPPPPSPTTSPTTMETPVTTKKGLPVSLYGTLLLTMGSNDAVFNYEDVPMIASKQGSDPTGGDKNFYGTVRQSRLGMTLNPVDTLGGKLSGVFEFDMMGGQAPYPNGVGMNLFRMRLAYGRLDWTHWSVEAGQDWSIFAPLNPTSLNEYGIPEFTATGNAWIRTPQIRVEAKTKNASGNNLLWQVLASDPNMGDASTTTVTVARAPGIGERGRMPALESRVAFSKTVDDRAYTIGLSGRYDRGKNAGTIGTLNVQSPVDSWGAALDYSLPFSKYVNLTGEAYEGRALGIYSVASGESIGAVGTVGAHGVLSRGGWAQLQFNPDKKWQFNLAYGVDQPDDKQIAVGARSRNQQYMANVIERLTRNISASLEYRRILTDFRNQLPGNERGDHIDLGVAYIF